MKKKLLIALLALLSVVCLAFGLAACGLTHKHTFSNRWSSDSTFHWHSSTCGHNDAVSDKGEHNFDHGICSVCGYIDDAYITLQSKSLIENYISDKVFENYKQDDIQAQNWQILLDNKKNLNGCIVTYIYATNEHTHILHIDKINFSLPLEKLVSGDFVTFDIDSAEIENQLEVTASLVQTYEANADEAVKSKIESFARTDGYEDNVNVVLKDNSYYNSYYYLLQCNSGTSVVTQIDGSNNRYKVTNTYSFIGRQIKGLTLNYTVQKHEYKNTAYCTTPGCEYCGLEFTASDNNNCYVSGMGELSEDNLESLAIPSKHNGMNVTGIGSRAFKDCQNIYLLSIPSSVKSIGDEAFSGCKRISDLTLPEGLTEIGDEAFENCVSLYQLTIPKSVTSIGSYAFSGCYKLLEVYSYFDDLVAGSSSYGSVASHAKHVSPIINGDISRISEQGDFKFFYDKDNNAYMLIAADFYITKESYDNDNINYLELPATVKEYGYDIAFTYTIYDYAFSCLYGLKSITIPAPKGGAGITSISTTAFYNCKDLKEIKVESGNTRFTSVDGILCNGDRTEIIYIPQGIESIELPSTITTIPSEIFMGYSKLKSITIPDSVTSIGDHAFYNCTSLESVTIGNGVTSIGDHAFYNCTSLTSITIPDSVTSIGEWAFEYCSSLTSINIPDGVTSIGEWAFDGCTSLTSITIPDSVTSIGVWAFYNCTSLTAVYINDLKAWCNIKFGDYDANPLYCAHNLYLNNEPVTEITADMLQGVTKIKYCTFYNCTNLESITIPDSVTIIDTYAFRNCTSLESITIPDSVTFIGEWAFKNTAYYNDADNWINNVLYIDNHLIGAKDTLSGNYDIRQGTKTIADGAFYSCTSLTEITIPDSVTSIGNRAFYNCSSLTSIIIPNSVTTIGSYAFDDCTSLENVSIGNGVTSIGSYAFDDCTCLKSVNFGNDSKLETIGDYAFYNCTSLTSITIPNSVNSIGESAFRACINLSSVTFENTSGWKVSNRSDMSNAKTVTVTNATLNAKLLSKTTPNGGYSTYYWKRG